MEFDAPTEEAIKAGLAVFDTSGLHREKVCHADVA